MICKTHVSTTTIEMPRSRTHLPQGNQFHMTTLGSTGNTGSIHFPYQPGQDNHYAIATTKKDVLQCKVTVLRTSGDNYEAQVYDSNGSQQGQAAKQLPNDEDDFIVPGKNGLMDLAIIRTGQMGMAGTVGSEVRFNYGAASFTNFQLGTTFFWTTTSQGSRPP